MMQDRPTPTLLSVYIPVGMRAGKLVERMEAQAAKQARSLNWVACKAFMEYVEREEAKK
jgi:hypothetical protein